MTIQNAKQFGLGQMNQVHHHRNRISSGSKVMISIWLDQNNIIYYELLKPSETITGERYQLQLISLKRNLVEKRL